MFLKAISSIQLCSRAHPVTNMDEDSSDDPVPALLVPPQAVRRFSPDPPEAWATLKQCFSDSNPKRCKFPYGVANFPLGFFPSYRNVSTIQLRNAVWTDVHGGLGLG